MNERIKNPHAVALGRRGGLARKGKPGRKLTSEEAKRIRALRKKRDKNIHAEYNYDPDEA